MPSQSSILARIYDAMTVEEQDAACAQAFILGADAYAAVGDLSDIESEHLRESIIVLGYQAVILDTLPDTEITDTEYHAFDNALACDDPRIAAFVEGWRQACRQHQSQATANAAVWQQAQ